MKILLGVAVYPSHPSIYPATLDSIDALDRGEHEVTVQQYAGDDPKLSSEDNLTIKHNRMRQDALDGGYDALFTVEADMIIPSDALTKMASSVDTAVVYALYCSRHNGMWLCFEHIDGYKARALNSDPARAREVWGQVIPSEGVGFGCTLINRRVLEAIEFRRDLRKKFADDWTFALDVKERGFYQFHHLGVVCGHIVRGNGVMWPDLEAKGLYRVDGNSAAGMAREVPERAWYRCLRLLSDGARDYPIGAEIELNADAATILLGHDAIEVIEESGE